MSSAHARKRTIRGQLSKAHPGQAKGSVRKKLRRLQKSLARKNTAQARQDQVDCQIVIDGLSSWTDAYKGVNFTVYPHAVKYFGSQHVPALEYFRTEANLEHVSFERAVLSDLVTRGYKIEALEVEFNAKDRAHWGRCVWYKDHPSYHARMAQMKLPKATLEDFAVVYAMFRTQFAGDQSFGLISMQVVGMMLLGEKSPFLFHKTLVFRKVVLSPPEQQKTELKQAA